MARGGVYLIFIYTLNLIIRKIVVIFFEVFCDYTHLLYILEYEYDTHLP